MTFREFLFSALTDFVCLTLTIQVAAFLAYGVASTLRFLVKKWNQQ